MELKQFINRWLPTLHSVLQEPEKTQMMDDLRKLMANNKAGQLEPPVIPKIAGKWMLRQIGIAYEKCWYYETEEELNKALTEFLDIDYSGYNYEKYYIEKR